MSTTGAAGRRRIFVAYPYRMFDKHDYRDVFSELERKHPVKFVFADEKISTTHVFDKIQQQIRDCLLGLYDISGWNPNVSLEFGFAIGIRKPSFVLLNPNKAGSDDAPSDLKGRDRIEFTSFHEMKTQLDQFLECEFLPVLHGNTISLEHVGTAGKLHASAERYSHINSSKQRRVDAVSSHDPSTQWIVHAGHPNDPTSRGNQPIRPGDVIRLYSPRQRGYLHSNSHPSPITQQQEVTLCEPNQTDPRDNWEVEVIEGTREWTKWDTVRLMHVATRHPLHSHDRAYASGQQEVTCYPQLDENDYWRVVECS
jgi:hypothetical protein